MLTENGHFKAGTYTVSGNIWLPKSQTGLPLNPHLSNGSFPPKDPVSSNATLVVESNGHAYVRIPIVIQGKVMTVNSISGNGVSYSGGYAYIDLGTPSADQTSFSGTCTVNVTIGDLAMTIGSGIFNGVRNHTYTANWKVEFGAASTGSGGGTMPASALAILAGVEGTTDAKSAKDAALAALDEEAEAASAETAATTGAAGNAVKAMAKSIENAYESNPVAVVGGTLVAGMAVGAGLLWLLIGRKKKDEEE